MAGQTAALRLSTHTATAKLTEGEDGGGLIAVGHTDQGSLGGVGHKPHRHKDATADGDSDRESLLPGPPDDRDQGGQERDEGQQREPTATSLATRVPRWVTL